MKVEPEVLHYFDRVFMKFFIISFSLKLADLRAIFNYKLNYFLFKKSNKYNQNSITHSKHNLNE